MVQIIEENRKPSTTERFVGAFGNLGRAIPDFMQARQSANSALEDKLSIQSLTGKSLNNPMLQREALKGNDPYKSLQQKRLNLDSIVKRYGVRIRDLTEQLKGSRFSDRPALEEQINLLRNERNLLLDESQNYDDMDELFSEDDAITKPKFDKSNKEHQAKAIQLMKKYNNKAIVLKKLQREFSGL